MKRDKISLQQAIRNYWLTWGKSRPRFILIGRGPSNFFKQFKRKNRRWSDSND